MLGNIVDEMLLPCNALSEKITGGVYSEVEKKPSFYYLL